MRDQVVCWSGKVKTNGKTWRGDGRNHLKTLKIKLAKPTEDEKELVSGHAALVFVCMILSVGFHGASCF